QGGREADAIATGIDHAKVAHAPGAFAQLHGDGGPAGAAGIVIPLDAEHVAVDDRRARRGAQARALELDLDVVEDDAGPAGGIAPGPGDGESQLVPVV